MDEIPEELRELYDAAKGVENIGLPIPWAADRAVELIECIATLQARVKELEEQRDTFMRGLEAEENDCAALHDDVDKLEQENAALKDQLEIKQAEVDVLRGVDCEANGDGPCGICVKCLRAQVERLTRPVSMDELGVGEKIGQVGINALIAARAKEPDKV
jgi:hypothetical protein